MPKKLTQDQAIQRMVDVHGGKYTYEKFVYKNTHSKAIMTCPIHGDFEMAYGNHVNQKQGCKLCGYSKNGERSRLTQEEFERRSNEAHNFKYSYVKAKYTGNDNKVTIICPIHGEYQQQPQHHMNGHGCQQCHFDSASEKSTRKLSTAQFIEKAKSIHGDKYDYSETVYFGNNKKVRIRCKIHGYFEQLANDHLSKKAGCQRCAGVGRYTTEQFSVLATEIHSGKYTYENSRYITTETPVIITCPKHGDFPQTPHDHLQGAGCPSCGCNGKSSAEAELEEYIKSLGFVVETRNRKIIKPYEIDIVVESKKIGFEYNGLYFHSDKFERRGDHKTKTDMANAAGYRLVHIYEDDWFYRKDIVKSLVANILGVGNEHCFARKLDVVVKPYKEVKEFFKQNHLQGSGNGDAWCLMEDGKIVAAMQFSQSNSERGNTDQTRWELVRYATSKRVVGGASRLFSAFIKDNPSVKTIISYSDNDMFDGGMYEKIGFVKDSDVRPDYKYVVGNKRIHKASFKKSEISRKFPEVYDENLTEHEMCQKLGYYRIYNSGLTKWVWVRP